jgi:hypothetical protein
LPVAALFFEVARPKITGLGGIIFLPLLATIIGGVILLLSKKKLVGLAQLFLNGDLREKVTRWLDQ